MPIEGDWLNAYESLTYLRNGDGAEALAARDYQLDSQVPNMEAFWRRHVAPSTNRPRNMRHRAGVSPSMGRMGSQVNHVLRDLVAAAAKRSKPKDWCCRDQAAIQCFEILKAVGDALQKTKDLRDRNIQKELSRELGHPLSIIAEGIWKSVWLTRQQPLAEYRHALTHEFAPMLFVDRHRPEGEPMIIRPEALQRMRPRPNWNDQKAHFRANPSDFELISKIVDRVYLAVLSWINDVFREILLAMDPLLMDPNYQRLRGWTAGSELEILGHQSVIEALPQATVYYDLWER